MTAIFFTQFITIKFPYYTPFNLFRLSTIATKSKLNSDVVTHDVLPTSIFSLTNFCFFLVSQVTSTSLQDLASLKGTKLIITVDNKYRKFCFITSRNLVQYQINLQLVFIFGRGFYLKRDACIW